MTIVGCGDSVLGPSTSPLLEAWSPNLGIHSFQWQDNIQQPHLDPLFRMGLVRGIRLDYNAESENAARWAKERGADVLCIFGNDYLRRPNIEDEFDQAIGSNPSVDYWEIGNEVGLFAEMSPQEYMPIFMKLHRHVQINHRGLVIAPYAPVGGDEGAEAFETMMSIGLRRYATEMRSIPLISLHVYSNSMAFFLKIKKELERLPIGINVWVTETGVPDFSQQIKHVLDYYPKLRKMFRASRIYWYVASECTEFSLVGGLADTCDGPVQYSPLYTGLTGIETPPTLGGE